MESRELSASHMSRYSPSRLAHDLLAWHAEELCRLISALTSLDEVRSLVRDLLTPAEVVMLMRRFRVAACLLDGIDHRAIRQQTGAGMTTIQSISKAISRDGSGYRRALSRLATIREEIEKEVETAVEALPHDSHGRLKRRYSAYFALETAADELPKHLARVAAAKKRKVSLKDAERRK